MDKHIFHPTNMQKPNACVSCGLPQNHAVHHRLEHKEPELGEATRITRHQMFLEIANVVRKRSTCVRGKVGALIVREARIVSMGYNGAPPKGDHCLDVGCLDLTVKPVVEFGEDDEYMELGCQRAIHAEANAISWAARAGVSTSGCTMYCTYSPCGKCAQLIASAGIKEFYFENDYRLERLDILADAGCYTQKMVT